MNAIPDIKQISGELAVLTALKDAIETRVKELREQGREALQMLQAATGATELVASLPDGTPIAKLSLTQTGPGVGIDDRAFLEWVKGEFPEQVQEVVRPVFRTAVMRRLKVDGDKVVDTKTGEVVQWAQVTAPSPTVRLRFETGGRDKVAEAWRNGDLTPVAPPPELEPSPIPEPRTPAREEN